jgi:general secretion pathway protein D
VRRQGRRRGWQRPRLSVGAKRWLSGGLSLGFVLALAACDDLARFNAQRADTPAQPIAAASDAMPPQPQPPVPGRAVATMPNSRQLSGLTQPIVVRSNETPAGTATTTADPQPRPGDITLNFAGADIRDVINSVLGETLKLNYVIDPEVSGPVTFNVSRPVSRDEALSTLEAVLNSRGATMVQSDGIIRVMPLRREGKANAAAPIDRGPAAKATSQRTEAFPLRYVSPTDMQHVLEKVLPAGQVIAGDDKRRVMLVQGTPSELQLAEDTVRIFDIDQMSGMSMALVPLRNADPAAITEELRNIFAATRKEADADAIRFMPIGRLNAVMAMTRSGRYLEEARSWIARLDRVQDLNARRVYVYNLQYSKAAQVGQKLQGLLTGMDIQFKAPASASGEGLGAESGDAVGRPDAAKPSAAPPPGVPAPEPLPATQAVIPPPVPTATPAADTSQPAAQQTGVRIEADEAHNALLISANSRDYELIRQVLAGLDVPPLQVLIEVTVAEVVLNDSLNYGVEYFINAGKTNTLLTTSNIPAIAPAVPGFNLSWLSGGFQPRAILDLLSAVTQTRVISTPRLLVLSNQVARLQVGDVVPIITQSAASTLTSNPQILNNITYKETGVVLEVTPRVNSGGYVTMDVNQSVSDVVNTTTSQIDSPTIRQRRLTSTISVKSGESILLGGLIQQTDNRSTSGIPFLHDIPGLGALFGSHVNGAARTELIMLMTPHVIANDNDARDITARVERQFKTVLDASTLTPPRVPSR